MKYSLLKRMFFATMLLISVGAFAQSTVTGTVSDETGPLPGATISVKGTTRGVDSDFDGNFTITASDNDILVISFVGFLTQEITVGNQTVINVVLEEDTSQLDEVVVVGYGTQKRENITGATSFGKMDKIIADRPIVNATQALQGIAAGLQVITTSGQPGSTGTSINIRGFNSINGGGPLVLVDNVPMALSDVNPRDIESVSVLKDAAAASIYGARAAFGVILITTKKAKRNQAMKFSYSVTASISNPTDLPEKATTREFVEALNDFGAFEYFAGQNVDKWLDYLDVYDSNPESLTYMPNPEGGFYPIVLDPDDGVNYPLADSDVIGDFLDDSGMSTIHNFSMSGGGENISYRLSGGYSYEDGIMLTDKDSYKKYNFNSSVDADLTSNLRSTTNIMYRTSDQSRPIARYDLAIRNRMYDPTGLYETESGEIYPFDSPSNHVRFRTPSTTERNSLRFFQKLEYTPIKNLSIAAEYTYEKKFTNSMSVNNGVIFVNSFEFSPISSPETAFTSSRVSKGRITRQYNALNLYAKYKYEIDNHNFKLMVGMNKEDTAAESLNAYRNGLIDPNLPSFNLAISDVFGITDTYNDWAVLGYFSRLNYNYKEKYFLEVNARYDGASNFADEDRHVFLPSFSGGWNLAKESFMDNVDFVSMLKFRGSWGEIGNQQTLGYDTNGNLVVDYYPTISGYEDYKAPWVNIANDQRYVTFQPGQLVSAGYTWEKIRTINVGLDAAFLKNRLNTSFDLYSRETLGMLTSGAILPTMLGTNPPRTNSADLETRGWEVELSWNDRIKDFKYGVNFNLSNNESEITRYANETPQINQYYVGRKINEIWGYVTDGFYTADDFVEGTLDANLSGDNRQLIDGVVKRENATTPYPGDIKYVDLNGDGTINDGNYTVTPQFDESGNMIPGSGPGDLKIIGNSNRKYQFGINGFAEFKGFDFSFVISGVGKRDLWRGSRLIWPFPGTFDHIYKHQLNYWTPNNQNSWYPRVHGNPDGNTGSNYGESRRVQTKYLSDESYLRIQNLTLGYSLGKDVLDKIKMNKIRIFVAANNLHTFDNLPKGLEPDQGSSGVYPVMTNYSLGINLSF